MLKLEDIIQKIEEEEVEIMEIDFKIIQILLNLDVGQLDDLDNPCWLNIRKYYDKNGIKIKMSFFDFPINLIKILDFKKKNNFFYLFIDKYKYI